ncbi:MAG: Arc family DNA binding domain-containing protein [Actinomycetia bacterium]|nr:Arc family DNA binding domain-containing protein [Actinomycetes bacterium]MCP4224793.1 Arc family DNA binding domain-containing protein [Actinomycetes bacterium]MCP5031352.1 Arc family DNA binding domain-containing protein [Actinomycetes bacterium]
MAQRRKSYPLRIDPAVHAAIERWANDELRSVNAQIEFALRDALRRAGRLPSPGETDGDGDSSD